MELLLTDAFYNTLMPLLAAIIVALLTIGGNKLLEKLKIQGKIDLDRHIQDLAYLAVALAEEKAAAYLKEYGEKLESATKLKIAVTFILERIPALTEEQARMFVEAVLGQMNISNLNVGASSSIIELANAEEPTIINE